MRCTVLALAAATMLAACGGGDGGSDEDAPTQATAPAGATTFALSVQVKGLQGGSLSLNDNAGNSVTVTADGLHTVGELAQGTTYALGVSRHPAEQVCVVERPSGVIGQPKTLSVVCDDGIDLTLGLDGYAAGQVVMVDIPGDPRTLSAALDGTPLQLDAVEGAFAFIMPDGPPGTRTLTVQADGRWFSRAVTVLDNPLAEPPVAYLSRRANAAVAEYDALLAGISLDPSERAALQQLRESLVSEIPGIASLPAGDALRIARLLAANDAVPTQALATKAVLVRAGCFTQAKLTTTGVVMVVGGITLAGASVASGPGIALFSAVALGGVLSGAVIIREGLNGIGEACFSSGALQLDNVLTSTGRSVSPALKAVTKDIVPRRFNHDVPSPVRIRQIDRLSDDFSDALLTHARSGVAKFTKLQALLGSRLTLPGVDALNGVADLRRETLKDVPAASLVVESDRAEIAGRALQGNGSVALGFRFLPEPMPTQPMRFTFRVTVPSKGVASEAVFSQLAPLAAIAAQGDGFTVYKDGGTRHLLPPVEAATYVITQAPTHGTVVMNDAGRGELTYTAKPGFVGRDAFEYITQNQRGASMPGLVSVSVEENCRVNTPVSGPAYFSCSQSLPFDVTTREPTDVLRKSLGTLPWSLRSAFDTHVEYASPDPDWARSAPSGTALSIRSNRTTYDAAGDTFTRLTSEGRYDSVGQQRLPGAGPTFGNVRLARHPDGAEYYVQSAARVGLSWGSSSWVRIERRSVEAVGFAADGTPLYVGNMTECSRMLDSGMTMTVSTYAIQETGAIVRLSSTPAASSCPLAEADFAAVAPEVKPGDLKLDWATGAVR